MLEMLPHLKTEEEKVCFAHFPILFLLHSHFLSTPSYLSSVNLLSLKETVVDKGHICPTSKTRHRQGETMARKGEKKMDGKSLKLDNIFAKVLRKKGDGKREPKKKRNVDAKEENGSKQRRSARLSGGKAEDSPLLIGGKVARSKKRQDKLEVIVEQGLKRRKKERKRKEEEEAPVQVFRIHVSAAGEEQLREHLRGGGDTVMQVEV